MSWYKKTQDTRGMYMNVTQIKGCTYKDLILMFGDPNGKIKTFSDDRVHEVEWKLSFRDIPFKVRMDSVNWARNNWKAKKYQVPSVKEDYIDEVEIIGDKEFVDEIIVPILHFLSNKEVADNDLQTVIMYIFDYSI